jgi:L-ascorbate metabolism protein UlaG (beta-lactamase superfamily)
MKITLLGNSGFIVAGEKVCLIFDYYIDKLDLLKNVPFGERTVVFLSSHSHYDHFNKAMFRYAEFSNVGYVLGQGIPKGKSPNTIVLDKGQSGEALGVPVQAFGSTDTGVSFLTELEGKAVFHAGDLNDWYWEEESTEEELKHDEQWYLDEIAPLAGLAPDVAFLPLDARLGKHALRGALHFARTVHPKWIVPMHLNGGTQLPQALRQALASEGIKATVAEIVQPGDFFEIN